MIPGKSHVEEWAKYVAMNKSGRWYQFEGRPRLIRNIGIWDTDFGRIKPIKTERGTYLETVSDWTKSIREVKK